MQRSVFTDGTYADIFQPDTRADPFHNLYHRKRADVRRCIAALPAGSRVLDLGGGRGRVAIPMARRHQVLLCDISERMLELAQVAVRTADVPAANLEVQRVDASVTLPFADAEFTAAVALDLLVHLADPAATLRELRRVLRPDGWLLVDMTNSNPLWTLCYPRYVGRRPGRWIRTMRGGGVLPEWQGIVRHHSGAAFESLLRDSGFAVQRRWRYGPRLTPKWFLTLCRPA
jgi:ubiquinone/menaquinone biosynthesis C-methylase UbiE